MTQNNSSELLKTNSELISTNSELILIKSEIVFMPSDTRQFNMLSASSIAHLLVVFTIPNYILYSILLLDFHIDIFYLFYSFLPQF